MPVKPIAALAKDYSGIDPGNFGSGGDIDPSDMTAFGVIAGGVHYAAGCDTRYGVYPSCARWTFRPIP